MISVLEDGESNSQRVADLSRQVSSRALRTRATLARTIASTQKYRQLPQSRSYARRVSLRLERYR